MTAPTPPVWLADTALLIYIALATVILHLALGNRYGIHRDELATLEDARHLAWGYPAYPPVTPFFGRISLELFGTSIRGFRFFAGLAQAIAVVLTGMMARDMGARWGAQLLAAVAAVPFCLGGGYEMQYVAFDCLAWVSTAYFIVRLLISGDPRWWVGIGIGIGFGMLSKYTIGFFALSIVAAVLLTDARRYLQSKWLWIGVGISRPHMAAQLALASAVQFCIARFSPPHSRPRCSAGPDCVLSPPAIGAHRHPLSACHGWAVFLPNGARR